MSQKEPIIRKFVKTIKRKKSEIRFHRERVRNILRVFQDIRAEMICHVNTFFDLLASRVACFPTRIFHQY